MKGSWTLVHDRCTHSTQKLPFKALFIEASEDVANRYFMARYGRTLYHSTHGCCGQDYVIQTYATLEAATLGLRSHFNFTTFGVDTVVTPLLEWLENLPTDVDVIYSEMVDQAAGPRLIPHSYIWDDKVEKR